MAACLVVVPLLVSCATQTPGAAATGSPAATPVDPAAAGHIVGIVYWTGGHVRAPGPTPAVSVLPPDPVAGAIVTATPVGGDANQALSVTTVADGSYAMDVPPGTYDLTATLNASLPSPPVTATVAVGETAVADIYFLAVP